MAKKTMPQSLAAKRLILLIQQLLPEHGDNRRSVAKALGIDPTLPSKFDANPLRDVGGSVIDRLLEDFEPLEGHKLDRAFFSDPTLANPHYRKFVLRKTTASGRLRAPQQVARAERPHTFSPQAEAMLEAMGATERERTLFEKQLQLFNYPFVNGEHVSTFLSGLRLGMSMQQASDAALNRSLDAELERQDGNDDDSTRSE